MKLDLEMELLNVELSGDIVGANNSSFLSKVLTGKHVLTAKVFALNSTNLPAINCKETFFSRSTQYQVENISKQIYLFSYSLRNLLSVISWPSDVWQKSIFVPCNNDDI